MDTGRGVVGNVGTARACKLPVVFSAKPRIPLSPWPTTYVNAKVGAVELLLDPRQPLKRAAINNKTIVKTAFIRCFLILQKIGTLSDARATIPCIVAGKLQISLAV